METKTVSEAVRSMAEFSRNALAKAAKRHAETGMDQIAGFSWNPRRKLYEVEVCGYIVAECANLLEVQHFSDIHHANFSI